MTPDRPEPAPVYLAHSRNDAGIAHALSDHLQSVAALARKHANSLPWATEAEFAGLLHDLGEYGDLFQGRLRGEVQGLDTWLETNPGAGLDGIIS